MMKHSYVGRMIGGLVLISIGGIFILNMLGITDISIGYLFSTFWPVFLILGGIASFANGDRRGGSMIGSMVLILVGGYFLARNLDLVTLDPGQFFKFFIPAALIIAGVNMLFKPRSPKSQEPPFPPPAPPKPPVPPITEMESSLDSIFDAMEKPKKENKMGPGPGNFNYNPFDDNPYNMKQGQGQGHGQGQGMHDAYGPKGMDDKSGWKGQFQKVFNEFGSKETLNKSGFIGDVHMGQDYFELQPMNISHFIGDTIIDLTKAQIPYGETRINISAFIGDVKIFVPDDMEVGVVAVSSAFIGDLSVLKQKEGGFMSNIKAQTPYYSEANKKVKLIVSVFIGDVKVNMVG
ncbi:cell wall-active antibiotics response protein LiaF [Paenibacillus aceti]|nr:cell wall-active antibiotics response protein LiaF [Paenibacillus aceti]